MVNAEIRLITLFVAEDGEAVDSQQKRDLGVDRGSDHQLLIAKFRLKWKKTRKNTREWREAKTKGEREMYIQLNSAKGLPGG